MPLDEGACLLRAHDLSKWFGATQALRDVGFDVHSGEIHALVGANGSGKSTLVKVLCGAEAVDFGEIQLGAEGVVVGTVHQNLGLFGDGNVRENVCGVASRQILSRAKETQHVQRLFEVLGLSVSTEVRLQELPIDTQALIAVARAMMQLEQSDGGVLIIDEVTSILRGIAALRFADVLRRLRGQGMGIVLVSHDLDEVLGLADRITVMVDGTVVATTVAADVDKNHLIRLMTGATSDIEPLAMGAKTNEGELILEAEGLQGELLEGFDLQVRAGEVVGLIGVPGSGFDEVPYLLAGVHRERHRGRVTVNGKSIDSPASFGRNGGRLIPADRLRMGLAVTGSVLENFMFDYRSGESRWGLRGPRRERTKVAEAIRRYGVKCTGVTAPITSLSGGNQQKLIVARCLEARPSVLVLHEPTQGVDVKSRMELLGYVRQAAAERGLAVIYVSGDLDEVWESASRIVAIRRGRAVGEVDVATGSKAELREMLY